MRTSALRPDTRSRTGPRLERWTRLVVAAGLISGSALAAAACSYSPGGSEDLSVAIFTPEGDMFSEHYRTWSKDVEKGTDGRVTFEPYYGGSLTTITNAYEAVEDGTADVALVATTALSNRFPELSFLEGAGAFSSETLDGDYADFYDEVSPSLGEVLDGVKILSWGPASLNPTFVDRDKHLATPDDFEGRILRTAGKLQGEQAAVLGASPATVDPSELQVALQTGTVDAALYTPTLIASSGLQDVAPHLTRLPEVSANFLVWIMNEDAYESISAEDRKAMDAVTRDSGVELPQFVREREEAAWGDLEGSADLMALDEVKTDALVEEMRPPMADAADAAAQESAAGAKLARLFGFRSGQ